MLKVATITSTSGKLAAKIYRGCCHPRLEWDEYRVSFYVHNVKLPEADYYTYDIDDARGTAKAMVTHGDLRGSKHIGDQLNREFATFVTEFQGGVA